MKVIYLVPMNAKQRQQCNLCETNTELKNAHSEPECGLVRSNVVQFKDEYFGVWRCPHCKSIHSLQIVDLDYYYKGYPIQNIQETFLTRVLYNRFANQLENFGLKKDHRILEYGCGSGDLSKQLLRHGYQVFSYDPYTLKFKLPDLLNYKYDYIILQDVIEHVDDPKELLMQLYELLAPGGLLYIGTPNASRLDIQNPEKHLHALHQPYHVHILSRDILVNLAARCHLSLVKETEIYYGDTFFPTLNMRFGDFYLQIFGNNVDALCGKIQLHWKIFTPKGLFLALFGRWVPKKTQITALFQRASENL